MAKGNYREYLQGDIVWRKKYFYVLRPLLAIKWLQAGKGAVPTEFSKLVGTTVSAGALRDAIEELIMEKSRGAELDRGSRIPVISDFIDEEIERLKSTQFERPATAPAIEPLNVFFRRELDEVFGSAQ